MLCALCVLWRQILRPRFFCPNIFLPDYSLRLTPFALYASF
jgi:hypothetical protein